MLMHAATVAASSAVRAAPAVKAVPILLLILRWSFVVSWFLVVATVVYHLFHIQGSVRLIGGEIGRLNGNIERILDQDRRRDG